MTYVLDLSVRGTLSPFGSPGGGLETVARSPPLPYCRVAELGRGCTRMRGCAGNGHSPGEIQDVGGADVPWTDMTCAENSGLTAMCARKEKVWFGQDPTCVRGMMGVPRTEMLCVENSGLTAIGARKETVRFGRDTQYVCGMMGVPRTCMWCAENLIYIRPGSVVESPVCVWSVTGSLLFGSPLGRVQGVLAQDTSWIVLRCLWFHGSIEWWIIMSSNVALLVVDKSGAATSASTQLPGTFLGLGLDLGSDGL